MKNNEVKKYWDENADNWTSLSRQGFDRYRDLILAPAFFKMIPEISGLKGLDVGCGEGYNTRLAAEKGAIMTAIDISEKFLSWAKEKEQEKPLGITYLCRSATELSFSDNQFDFAIATMSLMDIAENDRVLSEIHRVVKPGGFFQFSISHPCFAGSNSKWLLDKDGKRIAMVVWDYFKKANGELDEWIFSNAPDELTNKMQKFRIPRFTRTLSEWLNLLIKTGFTLTEFCEPTVSNNVLEENPEIYDSCIVSNFLIIQCRKKSH